MSLSPHRDSEATSVSAGLPEHVSGFHAESLLTSIELARALKVSDRLPEVWRSSGSGPSYMRAGGRRVLYRWADVLGWLESRKFSSTAEESAAA